MVTSNVFPTITPLLRRPAVEAATGKSRSTIYREIARNLFPKPVCIGRDKNGNAAQSGWPAHEVAAINQARIAGKSDDEIRQLVAELEAARTVSGEGLSR